MHHQLDEVRIELGSDDSLAKWGCPGGLALGVLLCVSLLVALALGGPCWALPGTLVFVGIVSMMGFALRQRRRLKWTPAQLFIGAQVIPWDEVEKIEIGEGPRSLRVKRRSRAGLATVLIGQGLTEPELIEIRDLMREARAARKRDTVAPTDDDVQKLKSLQAIRELEPPEG